MYFDKVLCRYLRRSGGVLDRRQDLTSAEPLDRLQRHSLLVILQEVVGEAWSGKVHRRTRPSARK